MSRDRERQAIAQVACPVCGVPPGTECTEPRVAGLVPPGRTVIHLERRKAWQETKPRDAVAAADITMSDQKEGVPGRWHTYVMLAPLTERGRKALPHGPTRVEHPDVRRTLARLRQRGLIVMRED